jgi:CheY-like chemotaxis protein
MLFGKRNRRVKRILVVEDEPLAAFDNEKLLSDFGYEVVATHDQFDDAVETLEREQVDLILSDVRLGGEKSGLEIASEAKRRNIPLLFVTGHPPENACDISLGCLLKPYNDRTLKAALNAIDKLLDGQSPKPPKGLTLYPPSADSSAST